MKLIVYILSFVFFFQQVNVVNAKEAENHMCFKRGFEIIFPYQEGVFKIKKETNISKFSIFTLLLFSTVKKS